MPLAVADRPRRSYRTGVVTRILRVLSLLGMLALTIVVLRRYPDLPATIPTHLGASGDPDSFGPRWTLLVFLLVWWVLLGFTVWFSGRPRLANYPVEVTETNAQALYREAERMCVWLVAALVVIAVAIVRAIVDGAGPGLLWVGLVLTVGAVVVGVVRLFRAEGGSDPDA